jgi:hypothetical protein
VDDCSERSQGPTWTADDDDDDDDPGICLEKMRKTKKTTVRIASRDLNPGPPEYEGVLTT